VGPNKQMQMMIYVVDDCLAGSGMRKTYAAGDWIQDPLSEFMRAIGIGLEIKTAQRPRGGRRAETWKTGKWETLRRRNQEAGVTDRAAEDGKIGNASSGLRIARTVGTTEVAVKAQQGAVNLVAHSDRRAAATTRMEEGAEGTTEVAATAQQGAVTPVSHSDGQAAAETVVEEGSENWQMGNAGVEAAAAAAAAGGAAEYGPGAAAEAAAGTAAGVRPPRPADWVTMTRGQRQRWKQRGGRRANASLVSVGA